jgi:hypothetical protein
LYILHGKGKQVVEASPKGIVFNKFNSLSIEPIFDWLSSCTIKRILLMHYESVGVDNLI